MLNPILKGTPVLQRGGSKNSLKPRARTERQENKVAAGYLRDRDFDFYPPLDLSKPTVDCECNGIPIGWRWCRHEIENYLIDPAIVSEARAWPISDVEEAIRQTARKIRAYEAARWTIGIVRRVLPPHYDVTVHLLLHDLWRIDPVTANLALKGQATIIQSLRDVDWARLTSRSDWMMIARRFSAGLLAPPAGVSGWRTPTSRAGEGG